MLIGSPHRLARSSPWSPTTSTSGMKDLRAQGIELETAPALNPNPSIGHWFLRDPNGYPTEIQRFLRPAWPRQATGRSPRDWAT
jgi:hypothetical protein